MQDGVLHKDSTVCLFILHIASIMLSLYNIFEGVYLLGGKNSYESIKRYQDKAYDKILVRMPKGRKDEIKAHAEAKGKSVNGFINEAVDEKMERDNKEAGG